jgi:hypothetical protein
MPSRYPQFDRSQLKFELVDRILAAQIGAAVPFPTAIRPHRTHAVCLPLFLTVRDPMIRVE